MGCTPSKPVHAVNNTESKSNRPRRYKPTKEARASKMFVAHPDPQAARLHQKHKQQNSERDRLGRAKARPAVTFGHLAERGVIGQESLKRGSYMPK